MGRFLLFVLVVGGIALYLTNPTTAEVQGQLGGQLPPQLTGMPAPPTDVAQPPALPSVEPGAAPPMPDVPAATVPQGAMQLDRKDYYLFSVYKITVGGQQMPGCIVGIAKQAIPMTPDKCPS